MQLAKLVLKGEYNPIPSQYSSSLERCIAWLLNLDFKKRPNISQLLQYVEKKITPGYHGEGLIISATSGNLTELQKDVIKPTNEQKEADNKDKKLVDDGSDIDNDSLDNKSNDNIRARSLSSPNAESAAAIIRQSYSPQMKKEGNLRSPHRRRKPAFETEEALHQADSKQSIHKEESSNNKSDDDEMVPVDTQRVQVLLRRENAQHRKFLQMKTFFVESRGATAEQGEQSQSKSSIIKKIKETVEKIDILEGCMSSGMLPKSIASRFLIFFITCFFKGSVVN